LPPHLRLGFVVEDDDGGVAGTGHDLEELRGRLAGRVREAIARAAGARGLERHGMRTWEVGDLVRVVETRRDDHTVVAYPALVDEGDAVGLRLFETPAEQQRAMWGGTRRLLRLAVPSPVAGIERRLTNQAKLALAHGPNERVLDLLDECVDTTVDELIVEAGGPPWTEAGFADLAATAKAELPDRALAVAKRAASVLAAVHAIDARVGGLGSPALAGIAGDVRAQLARFVFPSFVAVLGSARLSDVERYLAAISHRLDKAPADPARDADRTRRIRRLEDAYERTIAGLPPARRHSPAAQSVRWMIEELRVSLFAQHLGTPYKVSEERVRRELSALAGAAG
ncbi:MAG TPA: DUF3418 domain-containing protein, partial [Acidimicrobiales bacterium]|nr:DUF3418 domain-containing protein [Acidimicrobiales bacterium]